MHKKPVVKLKHCEDIKEENTTEPICCDISKLTVLKLNDCSMHNNPLSSPNLKPNSSVDLKFYKNTELDDCSMYNNPPSTPNSKPKSTVRDNKRHLENYHKGYLGDDEFSSSEDISCYQASTPSRTSSSIIQLNYQLPFNSKSTNVEPINMNRRESEGFSTESSHNNINVYYTPPPSPISSINSVQLNHRALVSR